MLEKSTQSFLVLAASCFISELFVHNTVVYSLESQNHRMAWIEKVQNDYLVSTPLICDLKLT